jgi:hypothetical protein
MNRLRTRLSVLTLERRDVPSATLAAPPPALMPVVAHGQYDIDTTVEHDSVKAGFAYATLTVGDSGSAATTGDADLYVRFGSRPTTGGGSSSGIHASGALVNVSGTNTW